MPLAVAMLGAAAVMNDERFTGFEHAFDFAGHGRRDKSNDGDSGGSDCSGGTTSNCSTGGDGGGGCGGCGGGD